MVCNYDNQPQNGEPHAKRAQHTDPRPVDPMVPISLRIRGRYPMLRDMGSLETCTPTASRGREAPARACGGRRNHRGTLPGAALLLRSAPVARVRHVGLTSVPQHCEGFSHVHTSTFSIYSILNFLSYILSPKRLMCSAPARHPPPRAPR